MSRYTAPRQTSRLARFETGVADTAGIVIFKQFGCAASGYVRKEVDQCDLR
ncbi:hypothetical protein SAMN05216404_101278 [Nitrosospira multiformis]|uniref:Uncharacterized protein n=1 Tax=Nitrosospira multiformis TaxID=1231 RepID=A0A1H8BK46_9PROT|nr:hypothetical protein SAMN05216404_101278 [Nitrosospira multiformis]